MMPDMTKDSEMKKAMGKKGSMVRAANRFMQTSEQKDQKKGIVRNY